MICDDPRTRLLATATDEEQAVCEAVILAYRKMHRAGWIRVGRGREGWSVDLFHGENIAQGGARNVTFSPNVTMG